MEGVELDCAETEWKRFGRRSDLHEKQPLQRVQEFLGNVDVFVLSSVCVCVSSKTISKPTIFSQHHLSGFRI